MDASETLGPVAALPASCLGPGLFMPIVARLDTAVNRLKPDRAARDGRFLPGFHAWASTPKGEQP
jgi:hypothetical protein